MAAGAVVSAPPSASSAAAATSRPRMRVAVATAPRSRLPPKPQWQPQRRSCRGGASGLATAALCSALRAAASEISRGPDDLAASADSNTRAGKVVGRAPAVVACGDRPGEPWSQFRALLRASREESGAACSDAGAGVYAHDVRKMAQEVLSGAQTDRVVGVLSLGYQHERSFFQLCSRLDESKLAGPLDKDDDLAPEACVYGYVAALGCAVRAHLSAGDKLMDPSRNISHAEVAESWAMVLRRLLRRADDFLSFFESSGWSFSSAELAELVQQATNPLAPTAFDVLAAARARVRATRAAAHQGLSFADASPAAFRRVVRVLAFSLHAPLLQDTLDVWRLMALADDVGDADGADALQLRLEVKEVYSHYYCKDKCSTDPRLRELLDQHLDVKAMSLATRTLRFPEITDFPSLRNGFLAAFGADLATYDVLMCGEPPAFCALFPEGPAIVAIVGTPLGAYLRPTSACDGRQTARCTQETFYKEFWELASSPRNIFVATSMYLANQAYWNSGVLPRYVRPLGLYTGAQYLPHGGTPRDGAKILLSRRPLVGWDVLCVMQRFAALSPTTSVLRFSSMNELADRSYRSWASHAACIYLPYDPQLLTFHELYGMGVPIFVPAARLLPIYISPGYDTLADFAVRRAGWTPPKDILPFPWADVDDDGKPTPYSALRYWAELTDFVPNEPGVRDGLPGLLAFETLAELFDMLLTTDFVAISAVMIARTRRDLTSTVAFWRSALGKALSDKGHIGGAHDNFGPGRTAHRTLADGPWPVSGLESPCWVPSNGITHELCCDARASSDVRQACFDSALTYERCCTVIARDEATEALRSQTLVAMRDGLRECVADLCTTEAACNELVETPKCSAACAGVGADFLPQPHKEGSVTRSSILGRVLYCLAARPDLSKDKSAGFSVLELFAEMGGGGTALLSAGLASRLRATSHAGAATLVTFEQDRASAEEALQAFRRQLVRGRKDASDTGAPFGEGVHLTEPPSDLDSSSSGERWAAEVVRELHGSKQEVRAAIVLGRPYPAIVANPLLETAERPNAIRLLCDALRAKTGRGFDLVFLDTSFGSSLALEWPVVESACSPRWVVIHNTNLPDHAGWVKDHLLMDPRWTEVWGGSLEDMRGIVSPWQPAAGPFRFRRWSVLHKVGDTFD